MNTIQELQKLREELIREIDEKFDWIIDEVKKESVPSRQKESRKPRNYEIIYPLNVGAGIFKELFLQMDVGQRTPHGKALRRNC